MPRGLDSFKQYFKEYPDNYVIIGGTACEILIDESGFSNARATKDIDLVLVAEAINSNFVTKFWEYIKSGNYEHINKSTQTPQFYRFSKPDSSSYPYMIELFSRVPDSIKIPDNVNITPIPIDDDISSLSAILLDSNYYEMLKKGARTVHGVTILDAPQIIAFKAKAWLDLTQKRIDGHHVDKRDINKHKTDILRLSATLNPNIKVKADKQIISDLNKFIEQALDTSINLKQLKIRSDINTIKARLRNLFTK